LKSHSIDSIPVGFHVLRRRSAAIKQSVIWDKCQVAEVDLRRRMGLLFMERNDQHLDVGAQW
jgi:hypothetical protein